MMRFVIASGNKHKIEEIKYILQTELVIIIQIVARLTRKARRIYAGGTV